MARRRFPIFAATGAAFVAVGLSIGGWLVWDANRPRFQAPTEASVCWRMTGEGRDRTFTALSRASANLESCAGSLEALYLRDGRALQGAYQGRFIFIDENAIQSAETLDGGRWRIFYGDQREGLRKRIASQQRLAGQTITIP